MKKHYFARGRGMSISFLLILTILFSGTGLVFGQLLDPLTQPRFLNSLPLPARIDARAGGNFNMSMNQITQNLGLYDPEGASLSTTVWGYGPTNGLATYPGLTFVTQRDVPITVTWKNELPPQFLPVDPSLHIAHPMGMTLDEIRTWYGANTPTVTHLHGGHTESASDGLPEAWYTQGFAEMGPQFKKQKYTYDNSQEAATLWYHDHALGITRLNVYAGLAGFYLLRDANEDMLNATGVLPSGAYEIELVIQDRMFNNDGELYWPAFNYDEAYGDFIEFPLPSTDFPIDGGPTALAEFFGDFILVNGAPWPNFNVEPRKYRFRLLNGSDSRFYVLKFSDGTPFLQIGTDDGLIGTATVLTQLVIGPGERYDVVVDFSANDGSSIVLENYGPDEPFRGFNENGELDDGDGGTLDPADPNTTGQIMQFSVNLPLNAAIAEATVEAGTTLRPLIVNHPTTGVPVRQLVLFEGRDEYGRLQPLLGTMDEGSLGWFEPITENPALDAVEVWEVYNATADAHPIHLHLVAFQIINRESFTGTLTPKVQAQHNGTEGEGGILDATTVALGNDAVGPGESENGWKDTFIVPPGKVGRVVAKFDRPGRYVWHCHILSHEDHEMMRPFYVGDMPVQKGVYAMQGYSLSKASPYPAKTNDNITVKFTTGGPTHVTYKIYDSFGGLVLSNIQYFPAKVDDGVITIPAGTLGVGDYILTFYAGGFYDFTRIKVK